MTTTAELSVLNKILDLIKRCGVDPLSSEFSLTHTPRGTPLEGSYYRLEGVYGMASNDHEEKQIGKLWSLLGLDEFGRRDFETLSAVDHAIDDALSLAPRARVR